MKYNLLPRYWEKETYLVNQFVAKVLFVIFIAYIETVSIATGRDHKLCLHNNPHFK